MASVGLGALGTACHRDVVSDADSGGGRFLTDPPSMNRYFHFFKITSSARPRFAAWCGFRFFLLVVSGVGSSGTCLCLSSNIHDVLDLAPRRVVDVSFPSRRASRARHHSARFARGRLQNPGRTTRRPPRPLVRCVSSRNPPDGRRIRGSADRASARIFVFYSPSFLPYHSLPSSTALYSSTVPHRRRC